MYDKYAWEKVANVMVDSGQIMIGDPCYIKDNFNPDYTHDEFIKNLEKYQTAKKYPFTYMGASAATCSEARCGDLDDGYAVAVASGYGDGNYPVYVQKNRDGRVVAAMIDFDNVLDTDDEDEYDEDDEE